MKSEPTSIHTDVIRLEQTLGVPQCSRLLSRLRLRIENGEALTGTVILTNASPEERNHVAGIFGTSPSRGESLRVDLQKLESCLRNGEICDSLKEAVETLCGPIVNRRSEREAEAEKWLDLFATFSRDLEGKPDLLLWLAEIRARGLLRRLASDDIQVAKKLLLDATSVLMRLPVSDIPLPQFAVHTLGDAHALDPDRRVTTLVLRGIARQNGLLRWDDAESRREAWATMGVIADELSAPVLILNLPALPSNITGRQICLFAEAGEPTHLTVRQLLKMPPQFAIGNGRTVFVCENPTVVAAAADALGAGCAPLVCIQGQIKTSGRLLLNLLREAGWQIAYHGDFDWPGVQIANRIIYKHGAQPWRMSASDYRSITPSFVPLTGFEIAPSWDAHLAEAMRTVGFAVSEEQVLTELCDDLRTMR